MQYFQLDKSIILYRNQFEKLVLQIFGDHRIARHSLDLEGLMFRIKYVLRKKGYCDEVDKLMDEYSKISTEMRNSFSKVVVELIQNHIIKADDLVDVMTYDVSFDPNYVKFGMKVISTSDDWLSRFDESFNSSTVFNIFPNEYFRFSTDSYNDGIAKAYPELFNEKHLDVGTGDDGDVFCHSFTFQTSEACSLNCFAAGTKILMADGTYKAIEDIKLGEYVMGFDEDDYIDEPAEDFYPTKVIGMYLDSAPCFKLSSKELQNDILVTPEHLIYTDLDEWAKVEDLDKTKGLMIYNNGFFKQIFNYTVKRKFTNDQDVYNLETDSHTFIAEGLCVHNCTYCYQFNKSNMRMSFETAKEVIDHLLNDDYGYINRYNSPAIILEFIGGEPLLEISLTRKIYEYFLDRCYELNHPWFTLHRLSICSNGMQYFNEEVQEFFRLYSSQVSFNISIDGNKQLHDSCRIQPNGEGSYDIDMAALNHFNKHFSPERNSKMTLSPNNISYLYDSVIDFINHDMKVININCVFEEGWKPKHALEEYQQLKKLADYLIDNNLENIYVAIFTDKQEDKMDPLQDGTFCFKKGTTVATPRGSAYIENLRQGDVIYTASGHLAMVAKMNVHKSNDNVIIKATGAYPIHCTSDHKVFAKKILYMGWKGALHYSEPGFYSVSELKKGDRIALAKLDLSKNTYNIPLTIAYVLGIFLADGYVESAKRNSFVITPGYDEDNYYYNLFKNAGLKFSYYDNLTTRVYRFSRYSSEANILLYDLACQCGYRAHNKHFPAQIFKATKDVVSECIRGYVETGGYTMLEEKQNAGTIKINTVSHRLANDLMLLLRSIGQYPTCYFYKQAGQMTIEERVVNVKDRYEIYYNPSNPNGNFMFKDDENFGILWAQIRGIEEDPEEYIVYCPTVENIGSEKSEHSFIADGLAVQNCGGNGSMLAVRPNGEFYPCLRYMPSSVGDNNKSMCIGTVKDGMIGRSEGSEVLEVLDNITRRSQNNDICYNCPIASSCASCLALGSTVYGTPTKRTTFTCTMVIAEALANVYYWNRLILKHPDWNIEVRKNNVPDEWSRIVISEEELEELRLLEASAIIAKYENE